MDDATSYANAVELWPNDEAGGAYMAVTREDPLVEEERALLEEAAHHIAPAVKNLIFHIRDIQLVEQRQRAEEAELSAQRFQE